jgi:hypothetical protein
MWDKANLQPWKNILRASGVAVSTKIKYRAELNRPFQTQIFHPVLDVHVLTEIIK